MRLQDKVCLVTGVGAGMGEAIAIAFAREGAHVVGAEIDPVAGKATMEKVAAEGGHPGLAVTADVGDLGEIDAMVEEVMSAYGRIDVLVNNAGVTKSLSFFDVTEADWDRIHRVNAKGLFFCMQSVARKMSEAKSGKIVNIASIAGKGFTGTSNIAYAGSKGAVIAMTRIAAWQLAKYDINVNAVCPGATRTDLYNQVIGEIVERKGFTVEQAQSRMDSSIPLRRSNEPADIAAMCVFLASGDARNITGQSYNVDGGLVWD